jgi:hypothetical protein
MGITHSYVHILNYGKNATLRSDIRKYEYFVPFFTKLNRRNIKLGSNRHSPCLADGTRQGLHYIGAKYYVLEDIFMHHMTRVRSNLYQKYETRVPVNGKFDEDWLDDPAGFIEVPNYFGINL